MGMLPKDAHAIRGLSSKGEVLLFPNRYQASLQTGLRALNILDCLLGLMEKTNDGTTWKWEVA